MATENERIVLPLTKTTYAVFPFIGTRGSEIILNILLFKQLPRDIIIVFSAYFAVIGNGKAIFIRTILLDIIQLSPQFLAKRRAIQFS